MSTSPEPRRGRLKLILLALVFLGPLMAAAWLYYAERAWQPAGRTNTGLLLEPIVNLNELTGRGLNELTAGRTDGKWVLIYVNPGACDAACEDALYRMRQSRLMLGRDMTRLVRMFLHGDIEPDKVLLGQHEGLISIKNDGLSTALGQKLPDEEATGGLFLVDPLGNLVMYFAGDLPPDEMVSDIEHLLDLSRIG